MAYCTRSQLEVACGGAHELRQLADQDGDGNEDNGIVQQQIDDAAGFIDSYASRRFAVPMPTTKPLAALNARLARFYLREAKRMLTEADLSSYESDTKWLVALGNGEVLPGSEPLPPKSQIIRDAATSRPDSKDVSRTKLKGYW